MRVLLLVALLSLPARAGDVVDVRTGSLLDGVGRTHSVTGGVWLSDERLEATARELATLRAENASLREAPPLPPWWTVALAVGVGLAGGVTLGLALR